MKTLTWRRIGLIGLVTLGGGLGLLVLLIPRNVLTGHTGPVTALAFAPDSTLLASVAQDDTLRLWRVADQRLLWVIPTHTGGENAVAFLPDGQTLVTGGQDGAVRFWRVTDGHLLRTLSGHTQPVMGVAVSCPGDLLASASWDGTVRLWRTADGALLQTLAAQSGRLKSVALAPDGHALVSGGEGGVVQMWSLPDGRFLKTLDGSSRVSYPYGGAPPPNTSVSYSPDGRFIASAAPVCCAALVVWHGQDGSQLYEYGIGPPDRNLLRRLTGHAELITQVAFSPDNQWLATNWDERVDVRAVTTAGVRQRFTGHEHDVTSLAFAPNGRLLASGSLDHTVRLWDTSAFVAPPPLSPTPCPALAPTATPRP